MTTPDSLRRLDADKYRAYLFAYNGQTVSVIALSPKSAQDYYRHMGYRGRYVGLDRRSPEQRWDQTAMAVVVPDGWRPLA